MSSLQPLRSFFMEDILEQNRLSARYNMGESGGRHRTVAELLDGSGVDRDTAHKQFLEMRLCDSPNWGREDLRQYVSQFHPGSQLENVLITTGTSEALFLLFHHLRPKSIALAMPAFQLLYEIPASLGARIIPLPVRWTSAGIPYCDEQEWLDILEREKPECLLVNHPHNPSGLVFSDAFLKQLVDVSVTHNITIIGDEHYRFLSSPTQPLGSTLYSPHARIFITGSFIKCVGAPGLRIGWCVGPHADLQAMQNAKNYTTHTVSPLVEWISAEVLKDLFSPLLTNMRAEWKENRHSLQEFLNTSRTCYGAAPAGGLVTSLGFRGELSDEMCFLKQEALLAQGIFTLPLSAMEFAAWSLDERRGARNNLVKGFGVRLGMGVEPRAFRKALQALEQCLSKEVYIYTPKQRSSETVVTL